MKKISQKEVDNLNEIVDRIEKELVSSIVKMAMKRSGEVIYKNRRKSNND